MPNGTDKLTNPFRKDIPATGSPEDVFFQFSLFEKKVEKHH